MMNRLSRLGSLTVGLLCLGMPIAGAATLQIDVRENQPQVERSVATEHPPVRIAQLFKRPPSSGPTSSPAGCTSQGCRLTIGQALLPTGTKIVTRYQGQARQIIETGDTKPLELRLSQPILNQSGQVVIPAESVIQGEVVPVAGGGQFIARQIIVNGRAYALAAQSGTLHDVKDPRQTSAGAIVTDAAIGAVGGAIVGAVLGGGVSTAEVIGGAAAGVVVGNVTAPRAVVINTGDQIELQLTQDLRL